MQDDHITRRDFVSITVGAGIVAAGAQASAQQRVVETNVDVSAERMKSVFISAILI